MCTRNVSNAISTLDLGAGGVPNIGLGVRGSVPVNYSIRVDDHIDAARGVAFVYATPGAGWGGISDKGERPFSLAG